MWRQRDPRAIYHPMTLDRAAALRAAFELARAAEEWDTLKIDSLNVAMPEFFRTLDRELSGSSLAAWKTYLRWQLIDAYAPYLSKAFVDEDFRMRTVLTGAQELPAAVAARAHRRGRRARLCHRRDVRGAELFSGRQAGPRP